MPQQAAPLLLPAQYQGRQVMRGPRYHIRTLAGFRMLWEPFLGVLGVKRPASKQAYLAGHGGVCMLQT